MTAAVLDCQRSGLIWQTSSPRTWQLRYADKQEFWRSSLRCLRLRKLNGFLARERERAGLPAADGGQGARAAGAVSSASRILRTQIRVLQGELGEDEDDEELEEYRQKLASRLKLDDEVRKHAGKGSRKAREAALWSARRPRSSGTIWTYVWSCPGIIPPRSG